MGQAKQRKAEIEQLKATAPHIRHKKNGGKLVGFYWGYKADQGLKGFEFSTQTCIHMGLDFETANKIGECIKEASDAQLQWVISNTTEQHTGLSREAFILSEKERLAAAVSNLALAKSTNSFEEVLSNIVVACCAVSTLVASGDIQQDNWNGDKFSYAYTNAERAFA